MIGFYAGMKEGIRGLFTEKKTFKLSETDIKNLEQYRLAPKEFQDDFDGTIFGAKSMGSMNRAQTKRKTLNSPFASTTNFNGSNERVVEPQQEEKAYVSPLIPVTNQLEQKPLQNYLVHTQRYEPETNDIDSLVA